METKKCNKCGKVKPLPEMDRRRDKKTGEFKYLTCCKSCKAEYQNQYIRENRDEINRKQRERTARIRKEKRTGVKQEPCKPVYVEPKSRVCKCCKQEKPISEFYQKYPNRDGNWVYDWKCKECKRAAYKAKHGSNEWSNPRGRPKKPSVWDLTVMPKISVEHAVQIANEAFPLLSTQYWKAGEAQKIYKQFGMEWSYL
jgi:hypothetical protein